MSAIDVETAAQNIRAQREAVERLIRSRITQGLAERIEDPAALAAITAMIAEPALSIECGPRQISKPKAALSGGHWHDRHPG